MAQQFQRFCEYCNKNTTHPKQWEDHIRKPDHFQNVEKFNHQQLLLDFRTNGFKTGEKFMILDLEGNMRDKQSMILLEISYVIFHFDNESQELKIHKYYNSLVKPGKISDYPEMHSLIMFTIHHKHGLPFSKCQEHGQDFEVVYQEFKSDLQNCKYVIAKGIGMENIFLKGCGIQFGNQTDSFDVKIFELEHVLNEKIHVNDMGLEKYPSCGHHIPAQDGEVLHCSLSEVHLFFKLLSEKLK